MGYKEDIAAAKLQIREVTNERIVDTVLRIHATLVSNPPDGTPIDLGWASASWFISVGSPTSGNGGTPTSSAAVGAREASQAQSVAQFVGSYNYQQGQPVYVGNNTPYIRRLNYGWSQQSPAGFVDEAAQDAVRWANNASTRVGPRRR